MNITEFSCLTLVGSFTAGFLGALTGLGGGVVIVPLLTLAFGVDIRYAVGASLISVIATFVTLGILGWPGSLRVVWAAARSLRNSDFLLLARANGCRSGRILLRHVLPNLRPVLFAQFWISIPLFILTEATLSMLGLGVMEPLPSWGNMLRGLEDFSAVRANPWMLSPLLLLVVVVICLQLMLPVQEELT